MTTMRISTLALAAVLATGAGAAYAQDNRDQDRRDLATLAAMKVTLPQAIATAEQQGGGRAVGADVSQRNGATRIAVEIVGPQGVKTVMVDGVTGQVTGTSDKGGDAEDND